MQRDIPELPLPWYGDLPLLFSGRESQHGEVAPAVDESGAYPALLQALQCGINRHALRNSSEIELDASRQCHLPAYRVYLDAAPSSSRLPGDVGAKTGTRRPPERRGIAELPRAPLQGRTGNPLENWG